MSNHLKNSTSPYLLQHANNPVEWFPWSDEALLKAKTEDKLILVSIGYSACHWCHVMEHESFENFEIAEVMNRHFICIKVDREERPDIDQVYMAAVQLMTGRGGWPLNCFTLPDGRPVYGGTYFPAPQWKNILLNLAEGYKKDKPKFEDYADQLTNGVINYEQLVPKSVRNDFDPELLKTAVKNWKKYFDTVEGGSDRAPKFPMPNNYQFLLSYYSLTKDESVKMHLQLTLQKMAFGGIYDQVGGGFARYSVDGEWKVPHFEKMLYDNAQLISLYSNSYKLFQDPLYKDVVYETIDFVDRELSGLKGNKFSALDADSEGMEGKFYVWSEKEFKDLAGTDFDLFAEYFNLNKNGFWEHENYILLRKASDEYITDKFKISKELLRNKVIDFKKRLLSVRNTRIKPGLDDKTLTSWNSLMVSAYLDAYDAFQESSYLESAIYTTNFILENLMLPEGTLNRNYKKDISNINGYLEDYAFFIQALIKLYQATFDMKWLNTAKLLMEQATLNFSEEDGSMFYFTSKTDTPLIARKMELQDNVIPASNSQMAINLFFLGRYFEIPDWILRSKQMLSNMEKFLVEYPSAYSNWLLLWTYFSQPDRELVICGKEALQKRNSILKNYLVPGTLIAGCVDQENLGYTLNRLVKGKTYLYFCENQTCMLPIEDESKVLEKVL